MQNLLIAANLVVSVALVLLGVVWTRGFPKYVERRADNLATKQDIAEITTRTEQARLPFVEAIERLRADVQRQSATLSRRQELYIELAQAAADVFLSGRAARDDDKRRFQAAYSAAFLYAPDDVVRALNAHVDLQLAYPNFDAAARDRLQPELKQTYDTLMLALRREAFHSDTTVQDGSFRFFSFGAQPPALATTHNGAPAV